MAIKVHTVQTNLDWELLAAISRLESFGGTWENLERTGGASLSQLKSIATVQSVGASTRIEGGALSDAEVDKLLSSLAIQKLTERDQQEVAGYFEALEIILSEYSSMDISENAIRDLHNRMLRYSTKDTWHRGQYKQHANHVEAQLPDGMKQIIFKTTSPGYATDDAMRALIAWYHEDTETHMLVKIAVFVYDLLSIHPFQDGNGRMSRLMATLLLLKAGYTWIQYVSFEHVIENRKQEYYRRLRECQSLRPGENINPWIRFFMECLVVLTSSLDKKLKETGAESQLSIREKTIFTIVREKPNLTSGEIALLTSIPNPTVKRLLSKLVSIKLLQKSGIGKATRYTT